MLLDLTHVARLAKDLAHSTVLACNGKYRAPPSALHDLKLNHEGLRIDI